MIAVSLFSGCGGMDFGIEAAGFEVVYRNDFDKHCCLTLRLNGKGKVQEAPIEQISLSDIQDAAGSDPKSVDLLVGGPPCQPFSKSSYWARGDTLRLKDPRANTLGEYFRIVEELTPRALLLENVHGISYSGKEEGFQFILSKLREINRKKGTSYFPSWKVLNAADYGVPQLRIRFFLVAMRNGAEFNFPEPTHSDEFSRNGTLFPSSRRTYATAWDALKDIEPDKEENLSIGGQWAALLPSIPEGENYLWHTDRKGGLPLFGWRTRYWCFLLKLAKNRPSWTLQAQPGSSVGPFHWKNRKLSWKEMAAIQTFPKSFRINSPRVEIQRQIGNAVPSLLAEVLGRSIREQLTGKPIDSPLSLETPRSDSIPSQEPTREVPEKYLHLIGNHNPHPGTGKGKSYLNGESDMSKRSITMVRLGRLEKI